METLIIEAYESQGCAPLVRNSDGNYPMLAGLVDGVVDKKHFAVGRETKKQLSEIKTIGDRSAHNRRYVAIKTDLDNAKLGLRLVVEELLDLAGLKK